MNLQSLKTNHQVFDGAPLEVLELMERFQFVLHHWPLEVPMPTTFAEFGDEIIWIAIGVCPDCGKTHYCTLLGEQLGRPA